MSNTEGAREDQGGGTYRPTTHIDRDNPFRASVVDMASDGESWGKIYDELEECLDAVGKAAMEETEP